MNEMVRMMNEKIDKIFDCFMENGASDAEIYALIKLMSDKSKKMIDEHLDMMGDMTDDDYATNVVIEGTSLYTEYQE